IELTGGQFVSHEGGYSDFLADKAVRQEREERLEGKRQKLISRELEWMRRGPKARRTKSRDRIERFHALTAETGPEVELDVELVIPPASRLSNRVIDLEEVAVSMGD